MTISTSRTAAGAARDGERFVGVQPVVSGWEVHRVQETSSRAADNYDLVVHSIGTGEERTILPTGIAGSGPATPGPGCTDWFHDSKSVMTGISAGRRVAFTASI